MVIFLRLKSLELQGFKSFPDKTVLTFKDGITVVVGPNGSGKSNISDAVRWVLGELSAKNIRGTKMEDVIFGGSDTRRPMGYAEVSLVMDNTEGTGRLDTEYDEVTVTRRYYRGGESEYQINRKPARLKDIAELFMNTGVGRTGYSIIGQGRIAEIVSQKSDERRTVFEEAAGISKYRYKKNEAERKLADTDANLLRLSDIIGELGARVGPLEKEAAAAKEYVGLYEQKKTVDIGLWLLDADTLHTRLEEAERAYTASKLQLEDADGTIASLEKKNERLYEAIQQGRSETESVEAKIRAVSDAKHRADSTKRVLENEIAHIKEQILTGETEAGVRREALEQSEARREELLEKKKTAEETVAALQKQLQITEKNAAEQAALEVIREEQILKAEEITAQRKNTAEEIRLRLSSLEGSGEAESGRGESLEDELTEAEEQAESLKKELEKITRAAEEYRLARDRKKKEAEEAAQKADVLIREAEASRRQRGEIIARADSLKARADSLSRMDELLEGYNNSVKQVMGASKNGRLHGICGTVSQLIHVESEYAVAMETALGANLQNLIVEDEKAAKDAIGFLKQTGAGRATFYPITTIKAQGLNVPMDLIQRQHGFIGIADQLLSFDSRYAGVIGSLLGRTAVFDTLDHASDAARALSFRLRLVTLDGQIINAGGSYTGGSVRKDSGMLTRSSEIDRLRREEEDLRKQCQTLRAESEQKEKEALEARDDEDAVSEECAMVETLLQAENTRLEVQKTKLETLTQHIETIRKDKELLGARKEQYKEEHDRLTKELESAEERCREAEAAQRDAVSARARASEAHSDAEAAGNRLLVEKTAADKDVEALGESLILCEATIESLKEQIEKGEKSGYSLSQRLISAENDRMKADDETAQYQKEEEENEAERKRLINENLEREQQQNALRDEIREKNHIRETIFREVTKRETELSQGKEEQDRAASAMWEEYELTYSAAKELDIPPLTEAQRPEAVRTQTELKRKIRALGHVNVGAIEEYREVKERYEFNKTQYDDLCKARESLSDVIGRLEEEMRVKFRDAMDEINKHFKKVFRELFGGGNAELILSDPDDLLGCGIEINVAPPGKIIKSLSLLSGGEQAFVAIALIFAILNVNPTPFCIFDEIEAALDEVNVDRVAAYMKRYSEHTQFIVITHRRGTMEAGEMIYGITMPDRGVSRVLTMDVGEVEKRLGVKLN